MEYVKTKRPIKVDEMVLPFTLKQLFTMYVKKFNMPHILLVGNPGSGKTTVAKCLCNDLGVTPLFINASKDGGINLIRDVLEPYCRNPSISRMLEENVFTKKIVILDEIDNTTKEFKEAFKSFIEAYEKNVTFILTANSIVNFTAPLMSRFKAGYINFDEMYSSLPMDEINQFKKSISQYIQVLLKDDNIPFDTEVITDLIETYYPDIRSILNETERNVSINGGNLNKITVNTKYDISSYFGMNLSNLTKEINTIENKHLFLKNVTEWIIERGDESIFLIMSDMIERLKTTFNKSHMINLIIMLKKLNSQVK